MALLALSMWSWIGIAALGWVVFSFAFALWIGRLIRVSEQMATAPRVPQHALDDYDDYREDRASGVQFRGAGDVEYEPADDERVAGGSRY